VGTRCRWQVSPAWVE